MFLIQNPDNSIHVGTNPPGDDILEGLLGHYGSDVRIVRAATQADHDALTAFRNACETVDDMPVPVGNAVTLAEDGITIEARDKNGALVASYPGVLVYPTGQPAAPAAAPVDLAALHTRMVALGSSLDELAVAMGMKPGQPITPAMAAMLAAEVADQEAAALLPRVGQFGGAAPDVSPLTAPEPTPTP